MTIRYKNSLSVQFGTRRRNQRTWRHGIRRVGSCCRPLFPSVAVRRSRHRRLRTTSQRSASGCYTRGRRKCWTTATWACRPGGTVWAPHLQTQHRGQCDNLNRQRDNANPKSNRRCNNMFRTNLSGYVGHVILFSWIFTIACCLVVGVGLRLGLGLDLVSGW